MGKSAVAEQERSMRIDWIEVKHGDDYILRRCAFSDFTLLVGKTGVGKSEILNAIIFFKRFLDSNLCYREEFRKTIVRNYMGCSLKVGFRIYNDAYEYEVHLENDSYNNDIVEGLFGEEQTKSAFFISFEKLVKNGETLFYRDENKKSFLSFAKLPKMVNNVSFFVAFSEEDICKEVVNHFRKVFLFRDNQINKEYVCNMTIINELKERFLTYDALCKSRLHFLLKLALIFESYKEKFDEIKHMYFGVFDDVVDMKYEYVEYDQLIFSICHSNGKWVSQLDMSSGMLKTLSLIVLMKTSPEGSVLLIDEIENSLGINCLDVMVEELGDANDTQCVITSHHPYVINNISTEKWKVVSRCGDEICVRNADELGIGDTSHDSFYQLMNAFHFEEA